MSNRSIALALEPSRRHGGFIVRILIRGKPMSDFL